MIPSWKRLLSEGKILVMPGEPFGADQRSRWWGNPPAPGSAVTVEPFTVPVTEEHADERRVSGAMGNTVSTVRRSVDVPLAVVFHEAYGYAKAEVAALFGEFAVEFELFHGDERLGLFRGNEWGWVLE